MKTVEETARPLEVPSKSTSVDDLLVELIAGPSKAAPPAPGVVIGRLVAIENTATYLVVFPGQIGTAAVAARSVVDLHSEYIGKEVVLAFDSADLGKPIVIGVVRGDYEPTLKQKPGNVDVVADGERLIVSAREQLVLRCGEASITLTKAGKVLIRGSYVSSDSSGVMRLRGGSVQLN